MTVWDRARQVMAADANLGAAASYRQANRASATTLRVVRLAPDEVLDGFTASFRSATDVLMVPAAALPVRPGRDDTFTLAGQILTVLDARLDEFASAYRVTCRR